MNETEITDGILHCITSALKWDASLINITSDLKKEYGADSFEIFLLNKEIKEYFHLSISEEQLKNYHSIFELTKFLQRLMQESDTKYIERPYEGDKRWNVVSIR